MADFSPLFRELARIEGRARQEASDRAVAAARAILRDLIMVTPVDTSRAVSNWRVGIGSRPVGERPAFFPGFRGSTREISGDRAFILGDAALKKKKPGQLIYISNTVSYIGDLDKGGSRQFAGGFLARAELIGRTMLGRKTKAVR